MPQANSRPPRDTSRAPRTPRGGALALVCLAAALASASCAGTPSRASSGSSTPADTPRHAATTRDADATSDAHGTAAAKAADASGKTDAKAGDASGKVEAKPGDANDKVEAKAGAARTVVVASADSDADGIPDAAELFTAGDRESFRRWFTSIAEAQFYEPSKEWNEQQRDCAGLVRFAWREALRAHDRRWLARMGAAYEVVAPDVRAYTLERGPLGERLFRTAFGSFRASDLKDSTFSEFADARTLKDFNAEFVSRDARRAEPGDLIFFYQPWAQKYPFHVMIFLGPARADGEGARDWVVYHTGGSAAESGTVKKVRLAVLAEHPNPRWRPAARNRYFLGFYRLKILR